VQPYWESIPDLPAFSAVPQQRAPPWASIFRGCDEQFLYCLCLVFVITASSIYCLSPRIYQASFKCYLVKAKIISHASSWSSLHLGCWFWVCKPFNVTCLLLQRHLFKQTKSGFQMKYSRSSVTNSHTKYHDFILCYKLLHSVSVVLHLITCYNFSYAIGWRNTISVHVKYNFVKNTSQRVSFFYNFWLGASRFCLGFI